MEMAGANLRVCPTMNNLKIKKYDVGATLAVAQ
jgi:hypothetical protein